MFDPDDVLDAPEEHNCDEDGEGAEALEDPLAGHMFGDLQEYWSTNDRRNS
jgi:hypothetical protein